LIDRSENTSQTARSVVITGGATTLDGADEDDDDVEVVAASASSTSYTFQFHHRHCCLRPADDHIYLMTKRHQWRTYWRVVQTYSGVFVQKDDIWEHLGLIQVLVYVFAIRKKSSDWS